MSSDEVRPGPRLVVVQPDVLAPLFNFAEWFDEAGLEWTYLRPWAGDNIPTTLEGDGLVVLGGSMSSLDDSKYPWLENVRRLIRHAAERDKPTLGICLGGQLMAQAFGGSTSVGGSGLETGLTDVHWLPEARSDQLVVGLPEPFATGTMHGDMITALPADAVWLGVGSAYQHQAFRVGRSSWGIQFHPEIDHRHYQEWLDAYENASPEDMERLVQGGEDLRLAGKEVARGARSLALRYAALVREPANYVAG